MPHLRAQSSDATDFLRDFSGDIPSPWLLTGSNYQEKKCLCSLTSWLGGSFNLPPGTSTSYDQKRPLAPRLQPPVKTSLETLCFMVLNLETFDSLVFHRQYFTAALRQTFWHPHPRAAELSAAMWNPTDDIFHNAKLGAKSYFAFL